MKRPTRARPLSIVFVAYDGANVIDLGGPFEGLRPGDQGAPRVGQEPPRVHAHRRGPSSGLLRRAARGPLVLRARDGARDPVDARHRPHDGAGTQPVRKRAPRAAVERGGWAVEGRNSNGREGPEHGLGALSPDAACGALRGAPSRVQPLNGRHRSHDAQNVYCASAQGLSSRQIHLAAAYRGETGGVPAGRIPALAERTRPVSGHRSKKGLGARCYVR